MNSTVLRDYVTEMRVAKYSPITIGDRVELLLRFADWFDRPLLTATGEDLMAFQGLFAHLSPASVNIYSRHLKAFYDWAYRRRRVGVNPAEEMIVPDVPQGVPHPASTEDLRTVFACTRGPLRTAYTLAAFAGLRCGEICRLHRRDLDVAAATALVHGKGRRERVVPLLPPVLAEIGGAARGWAVAREDGSPFRPERLSSMSSRHLHRLGLPTTLHSMRHYFATNVARLTKDALFVRDLIGHQSVATTEIYVATDLEAAHDRLTGLAEQADRLLGGRQLYMIRGE